MSIYDGFLGEHVVIRTYSAGVHVGTLIAIKETTVVLADARRIYKWGGAFTLSEIAVSGLTPDASRMAVAIPRILLTQAIEVLPTSELARATFDATHEAV